MYSYSEGLIVDNPLNPLLAVDETPISVNKLEQVLINSYVKYIQYLSNIKFTTKYNLIIL